MVACNWSRTDVKMTSSDFAIKLESNGARWWTLSQTRKWKHRFEKEITHLRKSLELTQNNSEEKNESVVKNNGKARQWYPRNIWISNRPKPYPS